MTHLPTLAGATSLTDWGVIQASGADAVAFLHSQLSNDIKGVSSTQARLAAYCSAKGRMLSSLIVSKDASNERLWMACHASVLPQTLKRLRMFVLRSQVTLEDVSQSIELIGISQSLSDAVRPEPIWGAAASQGGTVVRLPNALDHARFLWIGPRSHAQEIRRAHPDLPLKHWQWLEVQSGVVPIMSSTVEQFVPQMINYEVVGGVDFKKGCYPGQEVVARSQYLGKLKRRGQLVHANAEISPGAEVFSRTDPGQPCGLVALSAPHPVEGWDAFIEIKSSAKNAGALYLGSEQGPTLDLLPMPYELPADAGG